jgi:predicted membrane channel-forming protein YqfA (hemolysin III family)
MDKIKDSIFKFLRLDNLIENLSGYVETRVELVKMEVREEIAKVISHGLMIGVVFLPGLLFLVFISIGFANQLNVYYGDSSTGFWVVSGIYGLAVLLIVLLRKKISHFFEQYLLKHARKKQK